MAYKYYSYFNSSTGNGGLGEIFKYADSITGHGFGLSIMLVSFVIMFASLTYRGYPAKRIFAPCFFVVTVIASMLRALSMVGDGTMIVAIILTVLSTLWLFTED